MVEYLGDGGKRLVELRRHLDEVAGYGCTGERVVAAVGQHAMQGVTKLMEERGGLVPGEERRLALGRLGVVAYIIYNR